MKLKNILFLLLGVLVLYPSNSQNLCIAPAHLKSDSELPQSVDTQVHSKILRALANNGISAESGFARYIIAPEITINSSHTSAGIPPMVTTNFDLVFSLVDLGNGKVFSSYSFNYDSKGANLANAIAKGLSGLNLNNTDFCDFLKSSKEKVLDYYEKELPKLIYKAKSYIQSKRYGDALSILSGIPEEVSGYESVLSMMESTYKSYAENKAAKILQEARAIWASSPDQDGAERVAELIARMPVGSSSAAGAAKLLKAIHSKIEINETRAWMMAQQAARNQHLERTALIKAARDVAISRAKNSRPIVVGYRIW